MTVFRHCIHLLQANDLSSKVASEMIGILLLEVSLDSSSLSRVHLLTFVKARHSLNVFKPCQIRLIESNDMSIELKEENICINVYVRGHIVDSQYHKCLIQ